MLSPLHGLMLAEQRALAGNDGIVMEDILVLVGGALQTYYFACAHGGQITPAGDPCDMMPSQFDQVGGAPAVDVEAWAASDKAALWRRMNLAYVRVAHAIGRGDLAAFVDSASQATGFCIVGGATALRRVSELIGTVHFARDANGQAPSTVTFGPSALVSYLRTPRVSTGAAIGAAGLGIALGVGLSALASGDK